MGKETHIDLFHKIYKIIFTVYKYEKKSVKHQGRIEVGQVDLPCIFWKEYLF